ncbi:MAG: 5-amino-6-(D-ribitylamino)uracil--L-tyrosine 4-hydroxyphenyl transferase CofH [Alphaproteobacteria bacterium]
MTDARSIIEHAREGKRPTATEALALAGYADLPHLMAVAESLTLDGHGGRVGYSRKVFIPLTRLCRDVCHYCTFATPPRRGERAYLSPEEVLAIARAGVAAGCKEALFTLGDRPEHRYRAARDALAALGHGNTLAYLEASARLVREETGLLPHLNPGVMARDELLRLRPVSVSMGLMLESSSARLCMKGGPHWGSPDKVPARRLDSIAAAGELAVPFTSGILVGIGETRAERIEALLSLRDLHDRFGHIQEIIVQNFRAKAGTRMAQAPEPSLEDHLWTIAMARIVFGAAMSVQAPPNLQRGELAALIRAGVNDWGGVSPVTPDHVNPEAPWPHLDALARETEAAGRTLVERLAIGPRHLGDPARWLDSGMRAPAIRRSDAAGFARDDGWHAGTGDAPPPRSAALIHDKARRPAPAIERVLDGVRRGRVPGESEIVALFASDGADFTAIVRAADWLRTEMAGEVVTYVVNRNINYTNICGYRCGFCAFSKGRGSASPREPGYVLDLDAIAARAAEAWARGATEVCLQGGIHPSYTGRTYLDIVDAVKSAVPEIHLHAFSPLEITHGAETLGIPVTSFLAMLKAAGLDTLPGTAAEILDDEVRRVICPDKLSAAKWLHVVEEAHKAGLRTTATIMFGHVDEPRHWARHLLKLRALQAKTGGLTEFVPLPFVHMAAPLWLEGRARSGPTFREAILMHAVGRLVLHPLVPNIQTSWVKMGPVGAALALDAGANDLGGTLMNESITRAAGGANGQEMSLQAMEGVIERIGRVPRQRTTTYGEAGAGRSVARTLAVAAER